MWGGLGRGGSVEGCLTEGGPVAKSLLQSFASDFTQLLAGERGRAKDKGQVLSFSTNKCFFMDETSTLDNFPVLTGAAVQVADDEALEGVDVGEKDEVVAIATESATDLKGKMIPVKGRRIVLAGAGEGLC